MEWSFRSDLPIYAQLVDKIKLGILSGELPPGAKLPPVRELAMEAGVNPNTMQRALAELERRGLVNAQRTAGRFVTEDTAALSEMRRSLSETIVADFYRKMRGLGLSDEEIISVVHAWIRENTADSSTGSALLSAGNADAGAQLSAENTDTGAPPTALHSSQGGDLK